MDKKEQPKLRAQEAPPPKKPALHKGKRRGRFVPNNPEKYEGQWWKDTPKGRISNIIYRSGIELKMLKYLDSHPSILKWSSEEIKIPYVKPTTGRVHTYFVDFKVTRLTKAGKHVTALIEVKWSTATVPPKVPKKKTRRYMREQTDWLINQAKWAEAKKICDKNGWEWIIMTEKQLSY